MEERLLGLGVANFPLRVAVAVFPWLAAVFFFRDISRATRAVDAKFPLRFRGAPCSGERWLPLGADLPTVAESGFPGYELNLWFGLFAPAATPRAVIDRLNAGTLKVLEAPDTREALALQGLEPTPTTPAAFAALLRREIERWRKASALGYRAN